MLCDFDGTIVNIDTALVALNLFADPDWKRIEEAFEKGEVSFEDSLRKELGMINVPEERILKELDSLTLLRPNFARLVEYCRSNQVQLTVVSGGFDFCIRHFLDRDDWLKIVHIHAPKSQFTSNGYVLNFPELFTQSSVNFKDDLVRREKMNGKRVIYVGNGVGDYPAASESDVVFAIKNSRLAELCKARHVPHVEIDDFQPVIDTLNR